jgi:hypothetical protein
MNGSMDYVVTRDDGDYDVTLEFEVTNFIPRDMTNEGWRDDFNVIVTCAWCDGDVFQMTPAEILEAEEWLEERVEI